MARTVAIGVQDFGTLRAGGAFYVDKTGFVKDWWESQDGVTLICRPRRFGKTLALSTVEHFLSTRFASRGEELFGGLEVWGDPGMRELQGTVPVVMVSFADCRGGSWVEISRTVNEALTRSFQDGFELVDRSLFSDDDLRLASRVGADMTSTDAANCIEALCVMIERSCGRRRVVLVDDCNSMLKVAADAGCAEEAMGFYRLFVASTLKANRSMERAIATCVAPDDEFVDIVNGLFATVLRPKYEDAFGFTQAEVDAALDEFGLSSERETVSRWYGDFAFGNSTGIYNPWSVASFLADGRLKARWVDASAGSLESWIVRNACAWTCGDFEELLSGGTVVGRVDDRVNFRHLRTAASSVWLLLLSMGYLKVVGRDSEPGASVLELALTNREVREGFDCMVRGWFDDGNDSCGEFARALIAGDAE